MKSNYGRKTNGVEKPIYTQEQRDEIVNKARELNFINTNGKPLTFDMVLDFLTSIGYEVKTKTIVQNGEQVKVKFLYLKGDNKQ